MLSYAIITIKCKYEGFGRIQIGCFAKLTSLFTNIICSQLTSYASRNLDQHFLLADSVLGRNPLGPALPTHSHAPVDYVIQVEVQALFHVPHQHQAAPSPGRHCTHEGWKSAAITTSLTD